MGRAGTLLALIPLLGLVVAPLAGMVGTSLRADFVERTDGTVYVGAISESSDAGVDIRSHGVTATLSIPREEVAAEGRTFSLTHYENVVRGEAKGQMLVSTLLLAFGATLLAVLLGLPLGVLLGASDLPGRRLVETFCVLPLVLPPILLAIASYYDLMSVKPEFLRAMIVFGLSLYPLVTLFVVRALRMAGGEALAAARLQTTPWNALARVALGPALPGAAAGALLVFVFTVADFAVPDFLGVTTARNTIPVFANEVNFYWNFNDNPGAAIAMGMVPAALAIAAFALVLWLERRREAVALGHDAAEPDPLPLGRAKVPALLFVGLLFLASVVWPAVRHLETAGGAHYGDSVALRGGRATQVPDSPRSKPDGVLDGLRKAVQIGDQNDRLTDSLGSSLLLAGGGALVALLLAVLLTELGCRVPRLDPFLLFLAFLPVAVPPMIFAVGWVKTFSGWTASPAFAVLLMGVRLLPFTTFAVRTVRRRIAPDLLDAARVAGLGPVAQTGRIVLPVILPGALLGLLLAFLFGLREVDAIVFTKTGAETLPVQLYSMIHYGFDVQVAGLSFLWMAVLGVGLGVLRLVMGPRLRWVP